MNIFGDSQNVEVGKIKGGFEVDQGKKEKWKFSKLGRGGFKESVDGNVTRLPKVSNKSVGLLGKYDGKPLPSNFKANYYFHGKEPSFGSGMSGGQVKKMGFGPETIPPRGPKLGAGFF